MFQVIALSLVFAVLVIALVLAFVEYGSNAATRSRGERKHRRAMALCSILFAAAWVIVVAWPTMAGLSLGFAGMVGALLIATKNQTRVPSTPMPRPTVKYGIDTRSNTRGDTRSAYDAHEYLASRAADNRFQ